jgi:tricarballylate dehydrogenase
MRWSMTTATAEERDHEVVVVGCGMAGLSAGVRAAELGADVAILEKSPEEERGGQTAYSESFRVPATDCDLGQYGYGEFNVPDYSPEDFYDDIMSRTDGEADPDIARTLVEEAGPTVEWLTEQGVEWDMEPLAVGYTVARTWFDNDQLVPALVDRAEELGADVVYEAEARELHVAGDDRVTGVDAKVRDRWVRFGADAVVLACGGYESSGRKRAAYMGAGYDDMKVRGSPFNTGEAIDMAVEAGARETGQWSGAHMALIDANAPDHGGGANRVDGYQYGVILNVEGERFLDEGEDARAHTYAKFGRLIFEQPDHRAYVVLDSKTHHLARATGPTDPVEADDLGALFEAVDVDAGRARETVEAFNDACDPGEFDPHALDGNATEGVRPAKSNWALPVEEPPFYAYPVTGGITFAFGGVETDADAAVLDGRGRPIPGLYAAGNSTGGLFYHNYPGGTGLTNAAVFGKLAAERAVGAEE